MKVNYYILLYPVGSLGVNSKLLLSNDLEITAGTSWDFPLGPEIPSIKHGNEEIHRKIHHVVVFTGMVFPFNPH
jgi:hypothetical protein